MPILQNVCACLLIPYSRLRLHHVWLRSSYHVSKSFEIAVFTPTVPVIFHISCEQRHACLHLITLQESVAIYDAEQPVLNNVPPQDLDTTVHECLAPAQHYVSYIQE